MKLPLYQVDAFTDRIFSGNPAAVCPLQEWLPEETMQQIAMENNLAETAFFVPTPEGYHIRWFTPLAEVDLCGHATLAAALVLYEYLGYTGDKVDFDSRSGILSVGKSGDLYTLDFPADRPRSIEIAPELLMCFNIPPIAAYRGRSSYLLLFNNESELSSLQPELLRIAQLDAIGVAATAKGDEVDFVSRFFAPQVGLDEDPVTGSVHTLLTVFWADKLQKTELSARQISARGGDLHCRLQGDRVSISGQGRTYLIGEIRI